ncbi:MAG: glutathione S-transferase N-terminal domain-containing protein [Reinekea forsetii]|jgi:glutaredoxin|uniref:Glutaredoxin n=1 Tax=Reinekea forsetii TaxID=1336806 RepID=A0A2K8KR30_9GAMM|nr:MULTISPECIES: glutathione S-transferase N-terminal domain-containing protein [Reinekea]ATX75754.1 glutaredoxin [Reinekea forsetii]MDO7640523.1 glutathione S-transferase N-terminal domain-containing protein [Reinekea forsetii]MDO7673594.1 glutathione S-transferase N-terminal domain-containing protein [Reinekea forsetii]
MFLARWILGAIILLVERLYSPKPVQRDNDTQAAVDNETAQLTLYQYKACPFCVKVRMAMKRQSLSIETRDAKRSDSAKAELLAGGGVLKVPCLKIVDPQGATSWLYESSDIIVYLNDRFSPNVA